MISAKSIILFDFDGVLLKHPIASNYQKHRSIRFLQKHFGFDYEKAEQVNKYNYSTFGHSAITSYNHPYLIKKYNEFVFDQNEQLYKNTIIKKEIMQKCDKQMTNVIELQRKLDESNVCFDMGIFTNAPLSWIETFAPSYKTIFNEDLIFTSSNIVTSNQLKPNEYIYTYVTNYINTLHWDVSDINIHFIDDSRVNLMNAKKNNWEVYHYKNNDIFDHVSNAIVNYSII